MICLLHSVHPWQHLACLLGLPTAPRATPSSAPPALQHPLRRPQAADPEFYRAADSLLYGQGKPSEAAVDRMVAELNDR